jgi:hypothetical protein
MPRFEKGSKEAKEWAQKMREARMKKMKGGMIEEGSDDELAAITANMTMEDKSPSRDRPSGVKKELMKPKIIRKGDSTEAQPKTTGKRQAESQGKNEEKGKGMKKGRKPKNIVMGGYLQPGEMPPAAGLDPTNDVPEYIKQPDGTDVPIDGYGMMCKCHKCKMCGGALITNPDNQYVPMLQAGLQKSRFDSGEIVGGKTSSKKIGRAFSKAGDKLTTGFAKAGMAVNPMTYAIKNKGTRDLMIQSGEFTNDYALPAVTTAGLPLYYGAAGTAGMMLGGPLGAIAATKGADMLWQEMVVKKGADPRERQKSKTLELISGEVGKLGASQLKAGMSGPKTSGPKSGGTSQTGKGMRKKKKKLIIFD